MRALLLGEDKLLHPEMVKQNEKASRDKLQSAAKGRQYLDKRNPKQGKHTLKKTDHNFGAPLTEILFNFTTKK